MKTIIIEGNIGAGKSTLLHIIKQYLNVHVLYEPIDMWQHIDGKYNLLEQFYTDPKRWAYSFQSYAFISRVMQQQELYTKLSDDQMVVVVERSVFSDRYCFAKNCYEQGYMNALEWRLYQEWFEWLVEKYLVRPDGVIYLRVEPEVCYARLQRRARNEESEVSLDYLVQLHELHELWLTNKTATLCGQEKVPVVMIDGDKEFETDIVQKERFIDMVTSAFSIEDRFLQLSCNDRTKESLVR